MGVKHIIGLVGIVVIFVLVGIVYDLHGRSEPGKKQPRTVEQPAERNPGDGVVQGTVPNPPPVPLIPEDDSANNPAERPAEEPPVETASAAGETASNDSNTVAETPPEAAPRKYVVQPRDTLHSIARKVYGDSSKWRIIKNANPDLIKDPNRIDRGWVLTIPAAGATASAAAPAPTAAPAPRPVERGYEYTVQPGDTLESIAEKVLKNHAYAGMIFRMNKGRISDPKNLPAGLILEVPKMGMGN